MIREAGIPHSHFYLEWIAYNAVAVFFGYPVGLFLAGAFLRPIFASTLSEAAIPLLAVFIGLFHGAVYGFIQWRKLAPWGLSRTKWIALSVLGWSLAYLGLLAAASLVQQSYSFARLPGWTTAGAVGLGLGVAVGAIQSIAVHAVSRPVLWIAANAAGFASGAMLLVVLVSRVPYGQGPGEGILQGLALLILLPLPGTTIGLFTAWSIAKSAQRPSATGLSRGAG